METPKQMGSEQASPREGVTMQQQGGQQDTARRDGKTKPETQMQGTQFTDWASI